MEDLSLILSFTKTVKKRSYYKKAKPLTIVQHWKIEGKLEGNGLSFKSMNI